MNQQETIELEETEIIRIPAKQTAIRTCHCRSGGGFRSVGRLNV